ncbi:LuxR family transcriptional regulator [Clostridiaceae bacterium UIB06]|uniref:LuxR family transcriptional regulator n=1 Tax=Clostridium thailandense TaxID=2794346 RepID=A0A949TPW5_9CLOT|nr:LuxR C-terminal-related transcriptional regulator [Clostridium thailandense]MBV7273222.1 LuxR family transcriptional regulator [Clostridium thailandense]MCH5136079.1 LuxR family transcriptional regulator [Clostridiaceae bacterium UIB06]
MILNYKHNKNKFIIPKKKCKIVYRDKILNRLDEALNTKLTIISAPAGSGKTTSVVSWIDSKNLYNNVMWISLDERDNSREAFWSCFTTSIEKLEGVDFKGEELNSIKDEEILTESIIDVLLNTISLINKDLIFVIDDFHFIKNEDVLMEIKHFIDGINDNVHIIMTSRTKPNINIARLRLDGEVIEIDRKELNFSLSETTEFLEDNTKLRLPEERIKMLKEATEGWIAGIQIAVLSMKGRKDITEVEERFSGSNNYIQDYFCEEVFNNQSEDIKDFLLKTCILDELSAALCNAVSCKKNSQQILEHIYDMNLFVDKLDFDGKLFRYYRLFKEFLVCKLNGINREEIRESSNRAARWYEENGLINNAINQYIKVGNFEPVIKLIEDECVKKILSNEYFYVMHWLESIPQDIILKNSKFCISYMYIYIYDNISYNKYLEFAQKNLESCTDEKYKKECLGILSIVKGDRNLIESEYKKSIQFYEEAFSYLGDNPFWNIIINLKLEIIYFYLQEPTLEKKSFDKVMMLSQSYQDDVLYLVVNRTIVFTKLLRGQLAEVENICDVCLNISIRDELKKSSLISSFYIALALVYYEKNEISKAEEYVLKGIKFIETEGEFYLHYHTLYLGYYVYAGILLDKNRKSELEKLYEKIEELVQKYNNNKLSDRYYFHKLKDYFEVLKMERFMESGRINLVEKYISKRDFKITEELVIFSKILIYKEKTDDALMVLNKILISEKESSNKYLYVRAYISRAEIFSQKDQYENATRDLKEALIMGYENGFIRLFSFKNIKMSKMLLKTIKGMKFNKDYYKMGEYLNKILGLYSTDENTELISKREKEVLILIENGAKNSEIAQKLFITESTAKSHILNIFSKLGVHNRIQAVAKAKEIGII